MVCVDLFPLSTTRRPIMDGLVTLHDKLVSVGIAGELWVDGSFLTEKIDPNDVDVVVKCAGEFYDSGTHEQRDALWWVIDNQKATLRCDSYAPFEYPSGHPLHEDGQWWKAYWHTKWGFTRDEDPKGIVVVVFDGSNP